MESIDRRPTASAFFAFQRRAELRVRKWMVTEIESAQKIIFRPRPDNRRHFLSVDEKHIVALAPPAVLILQHRHGHTGKVPASAGLHPDIIVLTIHILLVS